MIPISSAAQVRALDERAIRDLGIPGPVLMENAGRLTAATLRARFPAETRRGVRVLCGRGNNGGDGWVIARHLRLAGIPVRVADMGGEKSPDCAINAAICARMGVGIDEDWAPGDDLGAGPAGLLVDAMLGTGLSSPLRGRVLGWVERANQSGLPVVAVDLPTGLQAERGEVLGACVQARLTVTFGRLKPGFFLGEGPDVRGDVVLADIGLGAAEHLDPAGLPQPVSDIGATLRMAEAADVAAWLPRRAAGGHKGSAGHLAVLAGSAEKAGAGVLACNAAIRAGAGLVTLFVPREAWGRLGALRPEIMIEEPDALEPARFQALALGPGLGIAPEVVARCRALWATAPVPAVFDADGLNALAGAFLPSPYPRLVTPHPGEAARLLGWSAREVQADRLGAHQALAAVAPCLLKGRFTLVGQAVPWVNPTGGPMLATAGAGDVLTGLIGALLAGGLDPERAGCAGAFLHGLAAERAPTARIVAGDLVDRVPEVMDRLSEARAVVARV
ncbi:MAG: NAD(P)H-hydrate dehydratase [Pseudomonadota bacterium]